MINLNIIPEELKKTIKLKEIYRSYKKLILASSLSLIFFIGIYYAAFFYLDSHLNEIQIISSNLNKNTENYSKQISSINSKLDYIEEMQHENIKWIDLLTDLSSQVNPGILIQSINSIKSENTLNIRGEAKTRDSLLAFEKNLKSLSYLSNINIPLRTLIEKEDIKFDINVKIDLYEFTVK